MSEKPIKLSYHQPVRSFTLAPTFFEVLKESFPLTQDQRKRVDKLSEMGGSYTLVTFLSMLEELGLTGEVALNIIVSTKE